MVGFVATIIITGLYSVSVSAVSHTIIESCSGVFEIQVASFGFPLTWFKVTYPIWFINGGRCPNGYSDLWISQANAWVDFPLFGLNVLLYSLLSLPLTRTSRAAPRLNARLERGSSSQNPRAPDALRRHELIVIAASTLCLVWLILYFAGVAEYVFGHSGLAPLAIQNPANLSYPASVLSLFFSLVGIGGSLLSTWRFSIGGAISVSAGTSLLFVPGLFLNMFLLNPEFGMLYVLWTSTMLVGGFLALLKGVLHWDNAIELIQR